MSPPLTIEPRVIAGKIAIGLLLPLSLVYALAIGALYLEQASFIYPAPQSRVSAAQLGKGFADVVLKTSDGLDLNAVHRPARDKRLTLLFFHGNGDSLEGAAVATRALGDAGYGLLLVEYRGYGGNPGSPGEAGLYRDGRAALAWLAARGVPPSQIVAIGNSLGSGVATQLASESKLAGLAIISGFTSLPDAAAPKFRLAPVRLLLRDRYDNAGKVGRLKMPVAVVHGDNDTLIPVAHGVALAAKARRGTLVRVPGVGHELAYQPQSQAALTTWLATIARYRNAACSPASYPASAAR